MGYDREATQRNLTWYSDRKAIHGDLT